MFNTLTQDVRRRRLLVGGIAVALLLASFLTYTALTHRSATTSATPAGDPAPDPYAGPTADVPSRSELPPLVPTADPQVFAGLVAGALFEWDTSTVVSRTSHIERLIDVADPTEESTAGLAADIENYLPTPEAWRQLQQYETRQWIEIRSVRQPSTWSRAEAQAGPDGLLPGTTAMTVSGVRHRAGVWDGAPVDSTHDVSFTVFVVCGPTYPECHLLRLSLVDAPLD